MAMRSILNTTLVFGLVRVPVKVYSATSSHDLNLHQYHAEDAGRIRYEKRCEVEDEVVPSEEIVKGVETKRGVVLFDEDDMASLPQPSSREIETLAFVPGDQIDPIYYEKTYYLGPGDGKTGPYALLCQALEDAGRVALVRFTMRQRESLATVRPRDDVLVLETMMWPDEVTLPTALDVDASLSAKEMELAQVLIDAQTGEWRPEEYSDDFQAALEELIEAKRAGKPAPKAKPERLAKVISLVDALEKSVERADPDRAPAKKAARKSAKKAAKKTARKSTAKKTAKKAAARRGSG
ncbi:non-homologous end joining protein Ku [Glycomyces terrestris]|nr:Ku protein [Glycomyces terrestris]